MGERLFGPEWYAFLPYHYCMPLKRVVRRVNVPEGSVFFTDTLECGHVVRRVTSLHDTHRCPECPSELPYLGRDVEIIEDDIVPYQPGDRHKKGWCFVNNPQDRVPSVHKTRYFLVHPGFAPIARRAQEEDIAKARASNLAWFRKKKKEAGR